MTCAARTAEAGAGRARLPEAGQGQGGAWQRWRADSGTEYSEVWAAGRSG